MTVYTITPSTTVPEVCWVRQDGATSAARFVDLGASIVGLGYAGLPLPVRIALMTRFERIKTLDATERAQVKHEPVQTIDVPDG